MDIKDVINIGFTDKEAFIICKYLTYHKITIKTFVERFKDVYEELEKLKFNDSEIKLLFLLEPRIVCCIGNIENRINNMNKKILTGNESDIKVIARAIIFKEENLNNKYNTLIDLGFKKEQIKYILAKDSKLITRNANTIKDCFNFFINIGIPKNKVIKIFLDHSKIICKNNNLLDSNFDKLMNYGFTKEEVATLISNLPTILFTYLDSTLIVINLLQNMGLEKDKIKEKLLSYTSLVVYKEDNYKTIREDLNKKGLSDKQIDSITIKATEIITYIKNVINYFYDIFYKFCFENKDINKIIINNPKILYHSLEKIEDVLNLLSSFGIKGEELIKITTIYPMIFESNLNSIDEKLSLIFSLDLYESITKNPKNLIQGCEKTFLRYMYVFNELDKEIDNSNDRLIFASKPNGMPDMHELRKMYSYTCYKDNNIFKRLENAEEGEIKVKCIN